jgi:hypothetical protein
MNLIQVVFVLAGALGAVMIFQGVVFFLFMREQRAQTRDLLNRLMAKDFQEYVRGEAALRPEPEHPPPTPDEAIPIYS